MFRFDVMNLVEEVKLFRKFIWEFNLSVGYYEFGI